MLFADILFFFHDEQGLKAPRLKNQGSDTLPAGAGSVLLVICHITNAKVRYV